jgi:hypothetical protein
MTDLETRKKELEAELNDINLDIAKSELLSERDNLGRVSDILNDLQQNEVLEKHDRELCGKLFTAMERVDTLINEITDEINEL